MQVVLRIDTPTKGLTGREAEGNVRFVAIDGWLSNVGTVRPSAAEFCGRKQTRSNKTTPGGDVFFGSGSTVDSRRVLKHRRRSPFEVLRMTAMELLAVQLGKELRRQIPKVAREVIEEGQVLEFVCNPDRLNTMLSRLGKLPQDFRPGSVSRFAKSHSIFYHFDGDVWNTDM